MTDPEIIEFMGMDVFEFPELWNRSHEGKSFSVEEKGKIFFPIYSIARSISTGGLNPDP